ncbi:MAG: oligosaccharide flippase family protein [Bacteroidota bacterium]
MGIIEKQATKNAIYSYLGAALGFLTVMWSSHLLNPDENGLTRILVSISALFSQFAGLGFNAVTIRFFPYFRDKDKGHHGYLFYGIITTLLGFLICFLFFYIFKNQIVENNQEKSKLFVDYLFYLMPLTLFTLFFNLFDYYLRACYSSVIGSSSRDFTQRILILTSLFLYFTKTIDFNIFVFFYVAATCVPTLILLFYIIKLQEWHVKPVRGFVSKELRKEMIKLSLFSILSGSAGVLISNIDIIMVNQKLGLTQTGIYGIAFYFGTIIIIPSRSLLRIAMSIVSEAFKRNDLKEINDLYKKSCNSQLAIGLLLFIGIWSNIDNIMALLPPEYAGGRNVILFISAGYLIDMGTGINYIIMLTSKYYRYDGYFMFFVLVLTILSNYILIPIYGIMGSAIATAITIGGYNIMRWLFLFFKFKMQPYDINTLKIILIAAIAFLPGYFIPYLNHLILDIAVRSSIVGGLFILMILKFEATPEINSKIRKNLKRLSINI